MKFNLFALIFSIIFCQFGIIQHEGRPSLLLFDADGVGGGGGEPQEPTQEELEKSLDEALENMSKSDDGDADDEDENEDENEDDYNEDEYEEMKKKKSKKIKKSRNDDDGLQALAKSLPEMLEDDDEASEVINAIPFVKGLVDSVETQMEALCKALVSIGGEVTSLKTQLLKSSKLNVAQATMIKSISGQLKDIGDSTTPRRANLGPNIQVMKKSVDGSGESAMQPMNKSVALDKLLELKKAGKIDNVQVGIAEGRINKGIALDANIQAMLIG